MSVEAQNEALVRRWFDEVWNAGKPETIDELMAPDGVAHGMGPNGSDVYGTDAFKAAQKLFRGAFPDLQITLGPIVACGEMTATQFTCNATHGGDHLGIAATNRPVQFTGMSIARFVDGKIVEGWNCIDLLAALQQIGAVASLQSLP